jgi:hypothetical protein
MLHDSLSDPSEVLHSREEMVMALSEFLDISLDEVRARYFVDSEEGHDMAEL